MSRQSWKKKKKRKNGHKSYCGIKAGNWVRKCLLLWVLLRAKVLAHMKLYLIKETIPVAEPWLFCNKPVCPRTAQWQYWDTRNKNCQKIHLLCIKEPLSPWRFWDDTFHMIWYFSVLYQKKKNPTSFSFQWEERHSLNHKGFPLSYEESIKKATLLLLLHLYLPYLLYYTS